MVGLISIYIVFAASDNLFIKKKKKKKKKKTFAMNLSKFIDCRHKIQNPKNLLAELFSSQHISGHLFRIAKMTVAP